MALKIFDKIKPSIDNAFPVVDAEDVGYKEGRLSEFMPVCVTQAEYDALKEEQKLNANTPYLIVRDDEEE